MEVFNSHIGVLAYYDNYGATLELYTEQNYKDFHIKFSSVTEPSPRLFVHPLAYSLPLT